MHTGRVEHRASYSYRLKMKLSAVVLAAALTFVQTARAQQTVWGQY